MVKFKKTIISILLILPFLLFSKIFCIITAPSKIELLENKNKNYQDNTNNFEKDSTQAPNAKEKITKYNEYKKIKKFNTEQDCIIKTFSCITNFLFSKEDSDTYTGNNFIDNCLDFISPVNILDVFCNKKIEEKEKLEKKQREKFAKEQKELLKKEQEKFTITL